ncbi:hypothetical protein BaRGS_00008086, partial [Batillaria attramentaria]
MFRLIVVVVAVSAVLLTASQRAFAKPNVLFLVTDDLRPKLGCYGESNMVTPNLDNFATKSIMFERAYVQQAVCSPSRTSFLTGRRPDTTHIFDLQTYFRKIGGNYTTLPQHFKNNGYITQSVGKIFHPGVASGGGIGKLGDDYPYSWTYPAFHSPVEKFRAAKLCPGPDGNKYNFARCPVDVKTMPEGSLEDIQNTDFAISFLQNRSEDQKPFFLGLGFHKPHLPFKYPQEYLSLYPMSKINLAPDPFYPPWLPPVAWTAWEELRSYDDIAMMNLSWPFGPVPKEYQLKLRQSYSAAASYTDAQVGRILQALDQYGFANNTIITFHGDHARPNVLFLVVDDLRPKLGCYGESNMVTPNLDNFATKSIMFERAYVQQAVCSPSRTSFLTGRRPDTTHIFDLQTYFRNITGNFTTLPQHFKNNGYVTQSSGKIFHHGVASGGNDDFPYSWTFPAFHAPAEKYHASKVCPGPDGKKYNFARCPVDVKTMPYGSLEDIQNTDFAISFLQNRSEDLKPFFLGLGFHKPHLPFKYPQEYLSLYPMSRINLAPDPFYPPWLPEVAYAPWGELRGFDDIEMLNLSWPFGPIPVEYQLKLRQSYSAATTYTDAQVGRILQALDQYGFANNTIITFHGDHARPNVLFLVVDDLRPKLGCYGESNMVTPNLDNFATKSIMFERAYVQQAVCSPSRTSFLTGRRPDTTHIFDLQTYFRKIGGNYTTLPQHFKNNGYVTQSVGKIFHPGVASGGHDDFPFSWTFPAFHSPLEKLRTAKLCSGPGGKKYNFARCPVDLKTMPEGSLEDIQNTDFAISFLQNRSEDQKPFFLGLGFHKPHLPFKYPKEYLSLYPMSKIKLAPDPFFPPWLPDVAYSPWGELRSYDDIQMLNLTWPFQPVPVEYQLKLRQSYSAAASYTDAQVGRILQALDQYGFANNTIITFNGDH